MAATGSHSLAKTIFIEWMTEAAPLRKATIIKKMNYRSLLLSINEITHYFKKTDN